MVRGTSAVLINFGRPDFEAHGCVEHNSQRGAGSRRTAQAGFRSTRAQHHMAPEARLQMVALARWLETCLLEYPK